MPETVGTTGAVNTGTEAAAVKSETPATGANGAGNSGIDTRFAELTGELGRKNEKIKKLEEEKKALQDAAKTEDEKRVEALATERFGPQLTEAAALKEFLGSERDSLLAQVPDEHKGMIVQGDNIPLTQQITQLRSVLNFLQKGTPQPQPFSGGGNPGTAAKRTYSKAEYDKWAGSIYTDRAYYDANRIEMSEAIKDGRVEGLR